MSFSQDATVLDDEAARGFDGATLQIGNEHETVPDVAIASAGASSRSVQDDNTGEGKAFLSRNRPGSVAGRASVRSTSSRTSMRPRAEQTDVSARSYYCYKGSHFEKAVNDCKSIVKQELDGSLKSTWLLTEIDHWDFEREKIVLLCEESMIVVKYNFINEKVYEYKRILLHIINSIGIGDFSYPNSSLMPERKHGGIQVRWDYGQELSFGQKWNPWCTDIPWITLSHHPLIYNRKENETVTYNVDEFFEALVATASKVFTTKRPRDTLRVIEGPITIESYASPASLVFNQSGIGFFRDRNGVSF
ncbi:tumor protein p63-regulated gene 1-like protein [Plakobranchus ocellatus]|uniref:Tumor protein p63-regulated gene 1-like protein n=1 Tax=Plakobranchus ocellatus TaxID=259542 RepID=A0AAV3XYI4_9GAST|nr:tumor protein p63-regulated gene 1-like protein [Plakobranchus ocellatus]